MSPSPKRGVKPLRKTARRALRPKIAVEGESYPGDLEKLAALAKAQGLRGLREQDAEIQMPLEPAEFVALAERLEELGRVRILSFRPLFLVSKEALDFLGGKILPYIEAFHGKHPKEYGLPLERLADHFDVPHTVLRLALKSLVHEGKLGEEGGTFSAAGFKRELPPREEKALDELERTFFAGDFRAVSLRDIHEKYNIALPKLEAMLTELTERRRLVGSKDGFYLHARWLDELIAKLRALKKKDLTIAEFKTLTGLSRKYAIPLLELLDEMGVTRRVGSDRKIL